MHPNRSNPPVFTWPNEGMLRVFGILPLAQAANPSALDVQGTSAG